MFQCLGHDAITLRLRPNPWAENQHPTSAWHGQGKKGKEKNKKRNQTGKQNPRQIIKAKPNKEKEK